jgi:hypothetical protein
LVAQINRRIRAPGNADDLLVRLRTESETREWDGNGNPGLKNEIGTQEEEKNQEKNNAQDRENEEPAKTDFARSGKLH